MAIKPKQSHKPKPASASTAVPTPPTNHEETIDQIASLWGGESGAEEVIFKATKHELFALAKYWLHVARDIEFFIYLYEQHSGKDSPRCGYALGRVEEIEAVLGEEAVGRAMDGVHAEFDKQSRYFFKASLQGITLRRGKHGMPLPPSKQPRLAA
jgi:hypothetical protein